jgi:hypothetical protein
MAARRPALVVEAASLDDAKAATANDPYIEDGRGRTFMTPNQFDFSWRADCLNGGNKP